MALRLKSKEYKVGDTIKFSTHTRDGKHTATRKIVAISNELGIGIRFNGYNPYWLYSSSLDRILEHHPL